MQIVDEVDLNDELATQMTKEDDRLKNESVTTNKTK